MQVKTSRLQQECEQLSSVKEHLSLENQQNANELKVHVSPAKHSCNRDTPTASQVPVTHVPNGYYVLAVFVACA